MRLIPKVKLYVPCTACFGTGKKLEGARFNERGELEYCEDVLGPCSYCNGEGYTEKFVTLQELKRILEDF